jgi:hypothetical protein
MNKLTISLTVAAAATLAACGGYETVTPVSSTVVVQPQASYVGTPVLVHPTIVSPSVYVSSIPLRAGFGRVDSVALLIDARGIENGMQRIGLRMDDGSIQIVDVRSSPRIMIGQRVELTADAQIRYPVASR